MSGEDEVLREALWEAALGPGPDDDFSGHSPLNRLSWPPEDEGPQGGVFCHRWIEAQLKARSATVEDARTLRRELRQGLQAGDIKAVAIHPETGRAYAIPPDAWQATGETGRVRWWSGLSWAGAAGDLPYDVYFVDARPAPPAAQRKQQRPSDVTRRENTEARIIYGFARMLLGNDVDKHGAAAELARDLEALGLPVSRDTLGERLAAGRDLYDPARDTTQKS